MMAKGQLNALIYYQVSITDKEGRFDQILHSSVHEGAKFFSLWENQVRSQGNKWVAQRLLAEPRRTQQRW